MQLTERRLHLPLDRARVHAVPFAELSNPAAGALYFLVNPARGEAFLPKRDSAFGFDPFDQLNHQRLANKVLSLPFTSEEPGFREGKGAAAPELDDAWLAGAELWRVERENAGEFDKHFEVENFRLDPAAKGSRPDEPRVSAAPLDLGGGQSVSVRGDEAVLIQPTEDHAVAVVRFTRFEDHAAEYRWRYRRAPGGEITEGAGRVAEDYTRTPGVGNTWVLTPRVGGRHDPQLRVGNLRLKWSWQGVESSWLYF